MEMDAPCSELAGSGARPILVCVTGATGYIASWLVGSLIRRGYDVHATTRDAGKASWLVSALGGYKSRVKIFEADLNKDGSFDEAVKNCQFVLHVAASMQFDISAQENIEEQVKTRILEPALRGAINVLQACARAGSVKRVVFTSSISTITGKDDAGDWRSIIDESSSESITRVWKMKPKGWVYVISKLLTEEKAFQFAKEKGIDLVSIIPPTVAGPFLTPSLPASLRVLLSPITGDPQFYPILASVNSRLGSIPLVHIEDICNAHIFLMEQAEAEGRYICSAGSCSIPELTDLLSSNYPTFSSKIFDENCCKTRYPVVSSKKLTDLGFKFKYGASDIIQQSVACSVEDGFLR
ncbi:dihydroflavonol-4-reductase isoform X1 [Canna indica]|uniref:Dihydroflavonol-4-reductase isoform X1 n=1 Tax=Canna indica TaxID=4628 RepID=A0AAQ3K9S5_9LILI|nr:dihydroflavonol-4-reductase isoform X1 [Canna indica]